MKDYFNRLKRHPGWSTWAFMTPLGFLAALSNKTMTIPIALIAGTILSLLILTVILLSNIKKRD